VAVHEGDDALDRLSQLGLKLEYLEYAFRKADAEARTYTEHDPPSASGIARWSRTNRFLRDRLVPEEEWTSSNPHNVPITTSPDKMTTIIATTGDDDTGIASGSPTTKYAKGQASIRAIRRNRHVQDVLPFFDTQQPTASALGTLASALDVPDAFLTAPDIEEIPVGAISYRALSKITASQRDAARSAARLAVCLSEWIDERFRLPEPGVPSLPGTDPETCAEVVRARWGLGQSPTGNMVHLLEAHGVRVFSLAADCTDVDAFSFWWKGTPFVFLNTARTAERGRFDAAHELGHLVLHSGSQSPAGSSTEQEASRFAAALLMPRDGVLARGLHRAASDRILKARHTWKVSAMALAQRLYELNLLAEWEYRTACVNLSRMGYRSAEPGGIPRETSQVLAKVFTALRAEGITAPAVARDLHLTPDELSRHVFGLVPVAVKGQASVSSPRRPDLQLIKTR
jgi:Zn-dependent peptidase ImmA (M78 family)